MKEFNWHFLTFFASGLIASYITRAFAEKRDISIFHVKIHDQLDKSLANIKNSLEVNRKEISDNIRSFIEPLESVLETNKELKERIEALENRISAMESLNDKRKTQG